MSVYAIYVEKKPAYADEAAAVLADLRSGLQVKSVTGVRLVNRYFAEGMPGEEFRQVRDTIFSEPPVDDTYDAVPDFGSARVFASEYLPGQFDQRADSCAQCISLATGKVRPTIRSAKIYALEGDISDEEFAAIKHWLINPVESREASLEVPDTLAMEFEIPTEVAVCEGFIGLDEPGLSAMLADLGLAMDLADLQFCQAYFRDEEKRDPTITEIRMIDTYWSDHCRHTTFLTELDKVDIADVTIKESYKNYLSLRAELGRTEKPVTLMDLATIGARALKERGLLPDLDESEEINACSVKIEVDVGGRTQDWLLMFKNETHNHPTEIEPFGGAATCLGGAIRDPLSGRSFVYQAMRVTGAGNPLQKASETLPGKLPQRKICRTAAAGYSSYGNQIGLCTGHVHEIYHPGYVAKRMEIGAVLGAAPAANVVRERPDPDDVIILLGGKTGRDGCGGATGSSKSHTAQSLESCGAEVQKGNAPEERKLQRLFRNPEATRLIRRCNDFGAGGVAVSIGELADGVAIDLDKVSKKYEGLDGTELAISESQERMSVVVAPGDADAFIRLAEAENLEAKVVARVTVESRLTMTWNGTTIVNLARSFLNSNGAPKHATAVIDAPAKWNRAYPELDEAGLTQLVSDLNVCSQKGLMERFDSNIGRATVLAPYGGVYQNSPAQAMAAKLPVLDGETNTCSLMAWGFDAEITSASPYHGAINAVVHSVSQIIAAGGSRAKCWLTFQEYFERLRENPERWGKPAAALLGALDAQMGLLTASIGGKDSMSGSFENIDVPPTLVSFAVSVAEADKVVSTEFKQAGSKVYLLAPGHTAFEKPDFAALRTFFNSVEDLIAAGKIRAAWAIGSGGTAEAIVKMGLGNRIGFKAAKGLTAEPVFGGFVVEADSLEGYEDSLLGETIAAYRLETPAGTADMEKLQAAWEQTLEPVYPSLIQQDGKAEAFVYDGGQKRTAAIKMIRPQFIIPVFPGTNSEYDTAKAIEKAGGQAEIVVIRNRSVDDIQQSVQALEKAIRSAQAIVLPGGFSGGDEPDGSGKFITSFFRNPAISAAVQELLGKRDGLMCGICNGFQALIKLGLVPYGEIRDMDTTSPTLTYNKIGRHQSMLVRTRVASNLSPWLSRTKVGEVYLVPISHGEGRFVAEEGQIRSLAAAGQVATQYVDIDGAPSQDIRYNPNNSDFAIEGITSPDGRVFGRMAHNERMSDGLFRNIPGAQVMDIFGGAVDYYK
ncbi:phosphoribosylformylglycinamidine synthase [Ruminococcaceae bacterium OttesenSCG-928-L11]|nr:phosphoribosylformylglycinamidine synthase [Ruminococcaceae bacterium OttesenSCG-928-L11]